MVECVTVCNSICWALTLLLLVIAMGVDVLATIEVTSIFGDSSSETSFGWQSSDDDNAEDYCDCDTDLCDDLCSAGSGWIACGILAFLFGIAPSFLPYITCIPAMVTPIVGTLSTVFTVIFVIMGFDFWGTISDFCDDLVTGYECTMGGSVFIAIVATVFSIGAAIIACVG
eukprot:UN25949